MSATPAVGAYLVVTVGYWMFTLTDGALRMLVLLHFHDLGYSPLEVASLFVLYEVAGVFTNLFGGWLGARIGLNRTLHLGMALQVAALAMLALPDPGQLTVAWVMATQALSGVAKDLNKMSAKASVRVLAGDGAEGGDGTLYRWVARLTGSKNALKGAGFFLGVLLLELLGFAGALWAMAAALLGVLALTAALLRGSLGQVPGAKIRGVFSTYAPVNWLAAARLCLFAARDVWFVVGLPLFLYQHLGWSFLETGGFLALWVIGYGAVQASSELLIGDRHTGAGALRWVVVLVGIPVALALALQAGVPAGPAVIGALALFAAVFALNSAIHSYLILAWSAHDRVAQNVGFYYMANAAGRLLGTVLSGALYQWGGLVACLWGSAALLLAAALLSIALPRGTTTAPAA